MFQSHLVLPISSRKKSPPFIKLWLENPWISGRWKKGVTKLFPKVFSPCGSAGISWGLTTRGGERERGRENKLVDVQWQDLQAPESDSCAQIPTPWPWVSAITSLCLNLLIWENCSAAESTGSPLRTRAALISKSNAGCWPSTLYTLGTTQMVKKEMENRRLQRGKEETKLGTADVGKGWKLGDQFLVLVLSWANHFILLGNSSMWKTNASLDPELCFSNFDVHMTQMVISLKYRFWFCGSGWGPEMLHI